MSFVFDEREGGLREVGEIATDKHKGRNKQTEKDKDREKEREREERERRERERARARGNTHIHIEREDLGNTHIRKYTHARARTHTARQLGIHTHTQPDNSVGEGGDGGEEEETTTLPPYHATPRTRCTHSDGQVSRCSRQTQRPLGPLTTCGEEVIRTQGPAVPPRHINQ